MCDDFEEQLKSIVKNSDNYTKIYHELRAIFNVSNVELWNYNKSTKILSLLSDKPVDMSAESGLTNQVLVTKSSVFTNHVISEKKYDPKVDNINSYKIKSILVVPILHYGTMIGVIRLFRNLDNKQNFSSKNVGDVELLMPILSKIVLKKELLIEDILALNNDVKVNVKPEIISKVPVERKNKKVVQDKKVASENKKLQLKKKELEHDKKETQAKVDELEHDKKETQAKVDELEHDKKELELEVKELHQKIEKKHSDNKDFKESIKVLTDKLNIEAQKNKDLQNKIITVENEKNKIVTKFDGLQRNYEFLKKVSSNKDEVSKFDKLLSRIYASQNEHEHLMTLLEFAVLMDDFKNIPQSVEEGVENSKIVPHFLEASAFKYHDKKDEKLVVETFIKKIQSHCEPLLKESSKKLNISIKQDTPKVLVFHNKSVESIITRAIFKILHSIKDDAIKFKVSFIEKQLHIQLKFQIEKEKKVMKLFQGEKDLLNDANSVFTELNNKLLKPINGTIQTKNENGNYSFLLKVPAVIIKI